MLYRITYRNLSSGNREVYMNNTGFGYETAVHEVKLLKEQQDTVYFGRTRDYFKIKPIKTKKHGIGTS